MKFVFWFLVIFFGLMFGLWLIGNADPMCVETYGKHVCDSKREAGV
jgi:hypothetical protein